MNTTVVQGEIDRKYFGHVIDSGKLCHGETTVWEWLGDDLEEFNVNLNPTINQSKNIRGNTSFNHEGYEENSEVSPFKARTSGETSVLTEKLQEIIDNRYKDDNLKTNILEIHLWDVDDNGKAVAWMQECRVQPTSYGGNTTAYQIPFTIYYTGERTKGKWDGATKTFTPDSVATQSGGGLSD